MVPDGGRADWLQEAGEWSSARLNAVHAMPLRYVEAARVANEGVRIQEAGFHLHGAPLWSWQHMVASWPSDSTTRERVTG